jgi:hypothetical protein
VIERSVLALKKPSFTQLVVTILALSFVVGFAVFAASAPTNKGTTGAIGAERVIILSAERTRCREYGTYASITTLRSEGLLTFDPVYNSVVYLPGTHCGTIIVGSSSYQSTAN